MDSLVRRFRTTSTLIFLLLGAALPWPSAMAAAAAAGASGPTNPGWRTDRILVVPRSGVARQALEDFHRSRKSRVLRDFPRLGGVQVIEIAPGQSLESTLQACRGNPLIQSAEPDYLLHTCLAPDDPSYRDGTQWHLNNTGQSGGRAGADIDAPEAWEFLHDATDVLVAVVDSGIRYTHEDLADNIWTNFGEIPGNGIDDDRNGYVDDVHGINAVNGSGNPMDDVGHGTHVAGIIGAVGNNGLGGSGVAWKVKLMGCKFITTSGEGATSDAIECLDYARAMGAKVINCSWGNTAASASLRTAFQRLRDSGILVAIAAGNESRNNDTLPQYPANYDFDNLVTVVATTATDAFADFSNYGLTATHLGAPGVGIRSTWATSDQSYSTQSGTSMSAPVVAGMLALLRVRYPEETPAEIIQRLTSSTDTLPSLRSRCLSGGRANLRRALSESLFANFTASQWQGSPPLAVQFTNTTRGTVLSQRWDFGDGSTDTTASPTHVFQAEGNYSVRLEVTGPDGSQSSKSQTVMVVGNYLISQGTFDWIDPSAMTLLPLGDNSISSPQSLPFPFPFYGQTYDAIRIGANGILGFSADGLGTTANTALPSQALPNSVICPYWDNLNPGAGGAIRLGTVGNAPQRSFVVSWVNVPMNQGGARLTFQAVLDEGTGRIRFQYLQVQPSSSRGAGRRATVGVENQTGQIAARYLVDGSPNLLANLQTLVFDPHFATGLAITPSSRIAFSGSVRGPFLPESAAFKVSNSGDVPLNWHARHTASWLVVSPSSGTLGPKQSIEVLLQAAAPARDLAAGSYLESIEFVNEDNGLGNASREVSLVVNGGAGRLLVTPESGLTGQGPVGGPFSPASRVYTLSNGGDASLEWSASVQEDWTELSRSGGTLGPGETTSVTLAFGGTAADLPAGIFEDTLVFTNPADSQGGVSLPVVLSVGGAVRPTLDLQRGGSGGLRFELRGQPGADFTVESSNNLSEWSELATGTFPAEGVVTIPAPAPSGDRSFYRARSVP